METNEEPKYEDIITLWELGCAWIVPLDGARIQLAEKEKRLIYPVHLSEPMPAAGSITISTNGFLLYRNKVGVEWACPMDEQERALVNAIISAKDEMLDSEEAFKLQSLDKWRDKASMKRIIDNVNRKLNYHNMPITMSHDKYEFCDRFVLTQRDKRRKNKRSAKNATASLYHS